MITIQMDNSSSILPWRKAKTKRFNSVKPPKSRRLSLPSAPNEDIAAAESNLYGSTTSLPVFSLGGDGGEVSQSSLNTSNGYLNHKYTKQASPLSRLLSSSDDVRSNDVNVSSPSSSRASLKEVDSKSSVSSTDVSLPSLHDTTLQEVLRDPHLSGPIGKDLQSHGQKQSERTSSNKIPGSRTSENLQDVNGTEGTKHLNRHHTEVHDDTLSSQNGVIILNNVGVENANEYDRLHARNHRNDNELSILLQELDALIGALPASRQIGTPFSCSNFVAAQLDHRGGRIRLQEPDVCLCVPPGALPPGQPQTLYMYIVNPNTPALSDLGDEDHWLTPIVHCGPPGIQFRSHVALSLPSSVADKSSWQFTVSRGVQPEYDQWESLESRDDSVVLVKSGRITVLVDHFTPYGAKGKPNSGDTVPSKWMEAGVFVHPPCGESGEQEVQFHVRIWNIADRQRVLQEERTLLRTCLAEPLRAIRVYDSGCPVQVIADEVRPLWVLWNHTGKAFPFQNLWREHHGQDSPDSPSITFVAQASQSHISDWHRGSFRATIRLFQQDHGTEGISFIVKANPDNMGRFVFKDFGNEYGTTLLRQQPCFDQPSTPLPSALFPLNEEHFHEVCLQLDGIATETGEKSWRAFARTTDLNRKDLDAIRRCAQQHRHKSPSDLLLTYFIGDPCRGFDRLRTLQEVWYVLYHVGNNGAREEVEEEMYEMMTSMREKPRQRMASDISSVVDHPSELSSLVMTSDEQMSDLEEDEAVAKDTPLESTAIADYDTPKDSTDDAESSCSLPDEVLEQSSEASTNPDLSSELPFDEMVESKEQLVLNAAPINQDISTNSIMKPPSDQEATTASVKSPVDASTASVTSPTDVTSSSLPEEPFTDISDDLEMQLTEFSKHWAVSEDSLGSSGSLSPASEAELLKILLTDDGQTQLSSQNNVCLDLDDPRRQAIELPLNLTGEGNTNNNHSPTTIDLQMGDPVLDIIMSKDNTNIVELCHPAVAVTDKEANAKVDALDICSEPDVEHSTAVQLQESIRPLEHPVVATDLALKTNEPDICNEPAVEHSTAEKLEEGIPPVACPVIDIDLEVNTNDPDICSKTTTENSTHHQLQKDIPPLKEHSIPPNCDDDRKDSIDKTKVGESLVSSSDTMQNKPLIHVEIETARENKETDTCQETVQVHGQIPLEQENHSEKVIPNVETISKETQTLVAPRKDSENNHPCNEPSSKESNTPKKPNGHLNPKQNHPKHSPTTSPLLGKTRSPGKTIVKIAYQTTDLEDLEPTAKTQPQNVAKKTPNIALLPPSPRSAMNEKANVDKQTAPTNSPSAAKKKQHRVPPRSPKREDRDSLRKLARIALIGKQGDEGEADSSTALSISVSPQSSVFDFSQLQPVRDKHEEFV